MAAKKKKKGRKVAKRKVAKRSLRAGSIVTRKLSPATLKKLGMKLVKVGTKDGKIAYKLAKKTSRRPVSRGLGSAYKTPRQTTSRSSRKSVSLEDSAETRKMVPGAILVSPGGTTMRWVRFYRITARSGNVLTAQSLGQKYVRGDSQSGAVVPDTSKVGRTETFKIRNGSLKMGYQSWGYVWSGRPENVFGD